MAMASGGALGEIPDWAAVVLVARFLGVAPWELEEQPYFWFAAAVEVMKAEHEGSKSHR